MTPNDERRIRESAAAFADAIIAVLQAQPDSDEGFERLLTVEQAGERLHLSRATMWAHIAAGRILSIRPAGTRRRLIPASECDRIATGRARDE